ncbi:MAG: sigma 54-interacting transcriptional regulator, partial [Planctomycetota bacterium]
EAGEQLLLGGGRHSGTLFLDEVAGMAPATQQKLLRCLQERAVRPVGSTEVRRVDVRVISATNHPLDELITSGEFREDLYYRLNVVPVHVPSLAERPEDIPLLAEHFARKHARRLRRRPPMIDEAALTLLGNADWPGNVRQLENAIECAVTFADEPEIRPEHLAPEFVNSVDLADVAEEAMTAAESSRPADVTPLGTAIRYLERQMLQKALDASSGNKEQAANLLGIDRATLYRKLKSHRL